MGRKELPAGYKHKLIGFLEVTMIAMGSEEEGKGGGERRAGKL